jgi:hypothetical protein
MRPTTRSSELGASTTGFAIPKSSMPGSDGSSSTSAETDFAAPDTDDMTSWIERLHSLPRMTPISRSPSAIVSSTRSVASTPISEPPSSFASTATSRWSRLRARLAHP